MKIGIHDLNDLTAGNIIIFERYYTGSQLPDYLYKRPWRVDEVNKNNTETTITIIGINKNDITQTNNRIKVIKQKMLNCAKFYKFTTDKEIKDWVDNLRWEDDE